METQKANTYFQKSWKCLKSSGIVILVIIVLELIARYLINPGIAGIIIIPIALLLMLKFSLEGTTYGFLSFLNTEKRFFKLGLLILFNLIILGLNLWFVIDNLQLLMEVF